MESNLFNLLFSRKMAEKNLASSFTDQIPELLPGVDWDTGLGPIEPIENGELFCYCKKVKRI